MRDLSKEESDKYMKIVKSGNIDKMFDFAYDLGVNDGEKYQLINKQIIEVKHKLEESGIDYSHLVFMPVIPLIDGCVYEFILEEHYGIRVAKLVSAPND